MNRIIKFRAKRLSDGAWCYTELSKIGDAFKGLEFPFFVNPTTIGQFTGLTDKFGDEIYEGDVIESTVGNHKIIAEIRFGEFEWNKDAYKNEKCIGFYFYNDILNEPCPFSTGFNGVIYEVIGNIHNI